MDYLVVVDMQNDFIDGALGTEQAVMIVPKVAEKISSFNGSVYFTRDTHEENYLETQEGRNLPIPHCIRNTHGWEISSALSDLRKDALIADKPTFGSRRAASDLAAFNSIGSGIKSITIVGLCTDICVISNALLIKAFVPEVEIIVDAACCAGVTPESHKTALEAMKACQIKVINE